MVTSDFRPEVKIRLFRACAMKKCNISLIYGRNFLKGHIPRFTGRISSFFEFC